APTLKTPIQGGVAAGTLNISGLLSQPSIHGRLTLTNFSSYGESFKRLQADVSMAGNKLSVEHGKLQDTYGGALSVSGDYAYKSSGWRDGQLTANIEGNGLALSNQVIARYLTLNLQGDLTINLKFKANIVNGVFHPTQAEGALALNDLSADNSRLGAVNAHLTTEGQLLHLSVRGELRDSRFEGAAGVRLDADNPVKGHLAFDRINLASISSIVAPALSQSSRLAGFVKGSLDFEGPLADVARWRATAHVDSFQITPFASVSSERSNAFELHNAHPISVDLSDGVARLSSFDLLGTGTQLTASGSIGYLREHPIDMRLNGSVDLRLLSLFTPSLQSSGESRVRAAISGTLAAPTLKGKLQIVNGAVSSSDFTNTLSKVNGSIALSGNRANIDTLTAESGGGDLRVSGFVTFGGAVPVVYHLTGHVDNTRVRYVSGISVTTDADLRLSGASTNSLLSGTATVSRVVFNPSADVGNILNSFAAPVPAPADQQNFLAGLHLDVAIQSSPNLQLSTSLSQDVEAGIDLHLRGTPQRPVLLGSVSANQGDIRVFGSRYSINRGEVSFVNTTRIEPILDLDLQTQTRGISVNIIVSGPLSRLNISYRSDPPLQPHDIVALLTVGRTPQQAANVQNVEVAANTTTLQPAANTLLGQIASPASGRLSKLFGVTNVRLDPLVQGITNTPESRLTIEQQVSPAITVTYVTNLEETSEQIFRLEWSLNEHYSIVALRDDNAEFGIDIQYKKRFK
ncbi:MAG: translocation/assembly module TamB, partial [Acidobacteriota bacterium]|nr:translocation/assembly module TamB [Acidobacteriota bacterium]